MMKICTSSVSLMISLRRKKLFWPVAIKNPLMESPEKDVQIVTLTLYATKVTKQ